LVAGSCQAMHMHYEMQDMMEELLMDFVSRG